MIAGTDQVQLEKIMAQVSGLIQDFQTTTRSFNKLLENEEINRNIREALKNIVQATAGARELALRLQMVVAENEGSLRHTLSQVARSSDDVKAITGEVNRMLTKGEVRRDLTDIMASLKSAAEKADQIASQMRQAISQVPGLMEKVHGTAQQAQTVVGKLGNVVDDVRKVTADPQVPSDIKATLSNVRQSSERLNDITASAQRILARAEKMRGIRIMPEGSQLTYDFTKATRPEGVRADLNLFIPRDRENFYQVGLFDATESNKFNFQFGRILGSRLNARWGLYASKLGVGADYRISDNTRLITDLFDPNNPQLNFRANRSIDENWGIWTGWEGVFGHNTFLFGVQLKQ